MAFTIEVRVISTNKARCDVKVMIGIILLFDDAL